MEDQENKTNEAAAISQRLGDEKQSLIDDINELNKEIQETDTEFRKIEELLDNHKRKEFTKVDE